MSYECVNTFYWYLLHDRITIISDRSFGPVMSTLLQLVWAKTAKLCFTAYATGRTYCINLVKRFITLRRFGSET